MDQTFQGQVLIIQGPRQVGKTTLAFAIVRDLKAKGLLRVFNCDDPDHRELLENRGLEELKRTIGDAKIVFIDEGQKLSTIGQTLKLLADHYIVAASFYNRLLYSNTGGGFRWGPSRKMRRGKNSEEEIEEPA